MIQPPSAGPSLPTLVSLGAVLVVIVGGFLALVITGHDVTTYTLFLAGPLVTTVVGALLSSRVKAVEAVARTVEAQTNGALSAQFSDVHDHLDAQTHELVEALPSVSAGDSSAVSPRPAARGTAGPGLPEARSGEDTDATGDRVRFNRTIQP